MRDTGLFELFDGDGQALSAFAAASLISSVMPFTPAVRGALKRRGDDLNELRERLDGLTAAWGTPFIWSDDLCTVASF